MEAMITENIKGNKKGYVVHGCIHTHTSGNDDMTQDTYDKSHNGKIFVDDSYQLQQQHLSTFKIINGT